MKFKAVLIDFDNTIIGTERYNHSIFLKEISRLIGRRFTKEDTRNLAGSTWKGIFEMLNKKYLPDMSPVEIRKVFLDAKADQLKGKSVPTADGLDDILALDIMKGIVTGSSRPEVDMFTHLIDYSKFDLIATDELYNEGKPAPDGYLYAVEKFGLEPHECICVEDSAIGIYSAKAAGCTAVFTREFADEDHSELADYTVCRLGDVINLL